jgi:hypothetical protein
MKSEVLKETDSGGKDERTGKGKRQCAVVDLLLALIIGTQKAQQEQDGRAGSPAVVVEIYVPSLELFSSAIGCYASLL